jgi:hypothetical protein
MPNKSAWGVGGQPGLARWGIAMSIWHPLWDPPSQAELAAGKEMLAGAANAQTSPRERAYLDAIGAYFSDTDVSRGRDRASAY